LVNKFYKWKRERLNQILNDKSILLTEAYFKIQELFTRKSMAKMLLFLWSLASFFVGFM